MNVHQRAGLLRAHQLDAASREALRNLPASGEARCDAVAHARQMAYDSWQIRETIGHVDPWAYSLLASKRLRAVSDASSRQSTQQTLTLLATDNSKRVRDAVAAEVARRELDAIVPLSTDPGFMHRDPMEFVTG